MAAIEAWPFDVEFRNAMVDYAANVPNVSKADGLAMMDLYLSYDPQAIDARNVRRIYEWRRQ